MNTESTDKRYDSSAIFALCIQIISFFIYFLIALLYFPILNLQAEQVDYLNATDAQIEKGLKYPTKRMELCKTPGLQIVEVREFGVYDISTEFFLVSVYAPCYDNFINEIKESAPSLSLMMMFDRERFPEDKDVEYPEFDYARMEISLSSIQQDRKDSRIITFLARNPFRVPPSIYPELEPNKKKETVENTEVPKYKGHFYYLIYFEEKSKDLKIKFNKPLQFYMPKRFIGTNQQPETIQMTPKGGVPSTIVTVIGKNFGEDPAKVQIEISNVSNSRIIFSYDIHPFHLGKYDDGQNNQILKFSIPDIVSDESRFGKISFFNSVFRLRILVNSRPSDYQNLVIIPANWKMQTIVLSNLLLLVLLSLISIFMKKINFIPSILLEKATNTYSLSRLQAFLWTIATIGCYFNLAISHALILGDGLIPEFNESLIILMTISFAGLIGSEAVGFKKVKSNATTKMPVFSDFFMVGDNIDFPKLQLFAFTIGSIFVYIHMVFTSNSLDTLPDVPQSLLALMGASQGGFIGGKLMGGKLSISFVTPTEVKIGEQKTITILGSGFAPETKILFSGFAMIKAEFVSQNSLLCVLPEFTEEGEKRLALIPPAGEITYFEKAITVKGSLQAMKSKEIETVQQSKETH